MTERLVDNEETGFRELWEDGDSEPFARIKAERLADKKEACWSSDWFKGRWKPEAPFGTFKAKR